jgi:hypothetical protein
MENRTDSEVARIVEIPTSRSAPPEERVPPRVLRSSGPVHRNIEEHLAIVSNDGSSATGDLSARKRNDKGIRVVSLEVEIL